MDRCLRHSWGSGAPEFFSEVSITNTCKVISSPSGRSLVDLIDGDVEHRRCTNVHIPLKFPSSVHPRLPKSSSRFDVSTGSLDRHGVRLVPGRRI